MTTHARVKRARVEQAVESIFNRHADRGDERVTQMGYAPADVLLYLREHAHRFADGLRVDDLDDVAVLLLAEWWDARRRELWWLDQVDELGADRGAFAAAFGKRSGTQAFRDWRDRLHQLLDETGTHRPDEQAARADRRAAAAGPGDPDEWLVAHLGEYEAIARVLVDQLYPVVDEETAGAILEVRRQLRGGFSRDQLAELKIAMEALQEGRVEVPRRRGGEEVPDVAEQEEAARVLVAVTLRRYGRLETARPRQAAGR